MAEVVGLVWIESHDRKTVSADWQVVHTAQEGDKDIFRVEIDGGPPVTQITSQFGPLPANMEHRIDVTPVKTPNGADSAVWKPRGGS